MYFGEGKFYHERMGEFIKVAKNLEVKEISDGVEMQSEASETVEENFDHNDEELPKIVEEKPKEKTQLRRTRDQISDDTKSTKCPECGAAYNDRNNMMRHYRSKHEGIKYPCNQCDYQATQQSNLQTHIQSKHEGIRYPCNQCDYQATDKSNLQAHISAKHSDTVLKCDYCDFQTKWRQTYNTHIRSHLDLIEFE